jgi:hypothetical protein
MNICFCCGKEVAIDATVSRKDICPFCRADLRCCRNCRFYDPSAYNQCREPQAERVIEKNRSNFCDFFLFRDSAAGAPPRDGGEKAREKLDALFKK